MRHDDSTKEHLRVPADVHRPVYISASLHVVQCSYHNVDAGEEGVVVDALGGRTHLVEMSFHLQVWVDVAGRFCSCCTL